MKMDNCKICPCCGESNVPTLIECKNCMADLTYIKITKKSDETFSVKSDTTLKKTKKCNCGNENPSNARKCLSCGEDISDIVPGLKEDVSVSPFTLCSADGEFYFPVKNEVVIGRENEMAFYLQNKKYVSRCHAKLIPKDNKLYILSLSSTNHTYVNNEAILENVPVEIKDGDEIGLGGCVNNEERQKYAAYFKVRASQCI